MYVTGATRTVDPTPLKSEMTNAKLSNCLKIPQKISFNSQMFQPYFFIPLKLWYFKPSCKIFIYIAAFLDTDLDADLEPNNVVMRRLKHQCTKQEVLS